MTKLSAPGMQRLMAKLRKYWADDPKRMMETIAAWWHDEGKRTFETRGSRVGRRWKPVTKRWQARKQGSIPNVNTGTLRAAMKGKRGAWTRIRKASMNVGVNYDAVIVNQLHKWRSLTGLKPSQMKSLDESSQRDLDRFDKTL